MVKCDICKEKQKTGEFIVLVKQAEVTGKNELDYIPDSCNFTKYCFPCFEKTVARYPELI